VFFFSVFKNAPFGRSLVLAAHWECERGRVCVEAIAFFNVGPRVLLASFFFPFGTWADPSLPRQHSLKQEEVEELQAAFNLFSNKKKELDGEDLKSVMRQLDMPASQQVVDAMMKDASKSGSGKVSNCGESGKEAKKLTGGSRTGELQRVRVDDGVAHEGDGLGAHGAGGLRVL
jgi:hypothetical protein